MASLKKVQSETMATIDTAKAMIDKVLTIMDIMVNMPSLSASMSTSPMVFLLQLLEHAGVTYEDLKLWLTDFLIYVVPAMEIGLKAVLLTNLKNMVSCSIDPRIPEKYRKQHKSTSDRNTPNEYGIDINIESIDYLDKMSVSPLSEYGSDMYFGLYGVDDVYKFARADDFDAFLWFVIHKGKFPMTTNVSTDLHEFDDRIHGNGSYHIAEENPSLFKELNLTPDSNENASSILPGNTFGYKGDGSPNIISMCIDVLRDENDQIVHNTLVPISDDLTSVNWYVRKKDQLGANLFGSYAAAKAQTEYKDGKKRTTGVETKNKSRDYSKEKAICNLQYIDPAYGDQEITGLANNRIRFTILPKPLVHIPNLAEGEPPWRFKRMLFDADGNYDPNGKYTINVEDDDKLAYLDGAITIDPRNGEVHINDKDKVIKNLVECYPGLTVYEFNYDYVMGMKLFDAKVLASTLLQTLVNTKVGINFNLSFKHQEATEKIKTIIRQIVNSDDGEKNECFFTFDNSKYDDLLKRAEEKRANRQSFGRTTREAGVFNSVNDILKEYDTATELHEKKEILSRAIDQAAVSLSSGSDDRDKFEVQYSFVFDLIENLILAMMNAIMSPKVLMLLEVNQRLMGGTWQKFTVEDLLKAMMGVINAMVKELRDLLIQELLKFLMKVLQPIIEMLGSIIIRERLEYYAEVIENIIKNCPIIWFRFGNQYEEAKIDTVDYADIDVSTTRAGEQPKNDKC
ncbi:MAG: hypothetical protein J6O49_21475 [Bacteroidaceae bacterium]|nr:hypothetical protein [Bacteroidaceae bacterium]